MWIEWQEHWEDVRNCLSQKGLATCWNGVLIFQRLCHVYDLLFVWWKASVHTGSPSLVHKRDVWEISFDRKTRIVTKIIKLQHTDLVCLYLWLHWVGFWAILARFTQKVCFELGPLEIKVFSLVIFLSRAYLLSESGLGRSKSNSVNSETQTNKVSMLKHYYF